MKKKLNTQIVIVGGGIVGLSLALALANENIPVALIETKEPTLNWPSGSLDARVSAINLASIRILKNLGVWNQLTSSNYGPLRRLMVWDHLGGGEITFDCTEAGESFCGYIIENRELIKILWEQLKATNQVQFFCSLKPKKLWHSHDQIQLILENGEIINSSLLIGADGSNSWVRNQLNVEIDQYDYQQQALIGIIKSEYPHQDTAWQNFLARGPIALLPLADKHQGAIVWSNEKAEIQRLLATNARSLNFEIANGLDQRLGNLELISEVASFPLMMKHAKTYIGERVALIGDAAHTIHPLAGQGANLGLLDVACLFDIISNSIANKSAIGMPQTLRRYQRWRQSENLMMETAMTTFHQIFKNQQPWWIALRSQGLKLTNQAGFFKNWMMHFAMGKQHFDRFKLIALP